MATKSAKWCVLALVVAVAMIVSPMVSLSYAQEKKAPAKTEKAPAKAEKAGPEVVKAKAQTGRGSGQDPNIKNNSEKNDPKSNTPAPAYRGGAGGRGFGPGVCGVRASNYTRWFVKVYVDGSYRGTVSPFNDGIVYVGNGATTFYARADFTDGSYNYWGTWVFNCQHGTTVTWELNY